MKFLFIQPPNAGFDLEEKPRLTFTIGRSHNLAAIALSAMLRTCGHEARFIDGYRLAWKYGNVRTLLERHIFVEAVSFEPDVIGITLMTSDVEEGKRLASQLRKAVPEATLVAGGPHPSGEPEATLRQLPQLDAVCIGQGEAFCLDLAEGKPFSEIRGCACLCMDEMVVNGRSQTPDDLDSLPLPAFDLLDTSFYSELSCYTTLGLLTKSLGLMTSRSCVGKCYFCSSQSGQSLRFHSPEYVIDACERIAHSYNIDTINFYDVSIGAPRRRLELLCELFLSSGLSKKFGWSALLRADQVDHKLFQLMKEAGCRVVMFGIESGVDRILKLYRKRTSVHQIHDTAHAAHDAGLLSVGSVIFGAPSEKEEEMLETMRFVRDLPLHVTGYGRFCPLPGSPAYDDLVADRTIDPMTADWELLSNYSLIDGPCYGDIEKSRFKHIVSEFAQYCYDRNMLNFWRENRKAYPEVVERIIRIEAPRTATQIFSFN